MKDSEKINIAAGIAFFVTAAFFSIALLVRALDFGMYSNAHNTIFFAAGFLLYDFYGFSSALIPLFILAAGVLCFLRNWSKKRGAHLAGSVVPFFTIAITEKLCRQFAQTDDGSLLAVKIAIVFFICVLVVAIEYLMMGIVAEIGIKKPPAGAVKTKNTRLDSTAITSFTHAKAAKQQASTPPNFMQTNKDVLMFPPEDDFFSSRDSENTTAVIVDAVEPIEQQADDAIAAAETAFSEAGFFSVAEADFLEHPFDEESDASESFFETAESILREEGIAVDSRDEDEAAPLFASALENKERLEESCEKAPKTVPAKQSQDNFALLDTMLHNVFIEAEGNETRDDDGGASGFVAHNDDSVPAAVDAPQGEHRESDMTGAIVMPFISFNDDPEDSNEYRVPLDIVPLSEIEYFVYGENDAEFAAEKKKTRHRHTC